MLLTNNLHYELALGIIIISIGIMIIPLMPSNVYSQTSLSTANNDSSDSDMNMEPQQNISETTPTHLEHEFHDLITTQLIPLTDQLKSGDYLLVTDLTPFETSVEDHSHIALKVPCDGDGMPKATVVIGKAPAFKTLDIGNAINNATLDNNPLDLSNAGISCLYHAQLPKGITDIALINNSNETLNFGQIGGYSVSITVHGTAILHK